MPAAGATTSVGGLCAAFPGASSPAPVAVFVLIQPNGLAPLPRIVAVSAGDRSIYVIIADGAVLCWGQNDSGQLGVGPSAPSSSNIAVEVPSFRFNIDPEGVTECLPLDGAGSPEQYRGRRTRVVPPVGSGAADDALVAPRRRGVL